MKTPEYYNNEHGSLYKIAQERGWNAYQFDIVKRIDRATKKGEFIKDLEKTKTVIDLWVKETADKDIIPDSFRWVVNEYSKNGISMNFKKMPSTDACKTEVLTDFVQSPELVDITTLSAGDRFLFDGNAHKMLYIDDSEVLLDCHILNEKTKETKKYEFFKDDKFVYKLISDNV